MLHLSVIQHNQSEWLGGIEDHLEGRGIRFGYHRPFTTGGNIPSVPTIGDGLILLGGGPWGSKSEGRLLPTLDAEVRLARACLMLDKPVMGFGLGAQILAIAADGASVAAPLDLRIETLVRTSDEALGGFLPPTMPAVVYMRDAPVPPAYATTLATDTAGRPAIFSIGTKAFGFIANPGIRRAMIEDLIMESDDTPDNPAPVLEAMGALAGPLEDVLVPIMSGLVAACGFKIA